MFDVIASLLSSIIFKNLLYLNLAPYLFNSEESAYLFAFACTEDSTAVPLGAKLLLKYIFESISRNKYFKSRISGTIPATLYFLSFDLMFCFTKLGKKSPNLGLILTKTFPY